ncbi:Helicase [Neofusicoccum parvum]|uniref:Helicase n=2 Tax=Neofusicoccum parvum TaxID=310453 RepID=A0ACB5RYP0_9PEZI|nr:putative dead deah box rna helicase protein [Neofusicoccum parvum UCRNP2]GME25634.1 Helicase [Neofusicoccum parvum]GME64018.1 Helicase [Neofusicoccum parvum]
MEHLAQAFERVSLAADSVNTSDPDWIDSVLGEQRPRKRTRRTKDELKQELEREFLTPSTSLNTHWLNELQQRWDAPINYADLFELAPTQTRTIIRFTREGLEGRVTGYKEITVPASSATAKNSTSLLRKPAKRADFVRGAAGFFPFAPGGLDGVEAIAAAEDEFLRNQQSEKAKKQGGLDRVINFGVEGGLLEVPPGFARGLDFKKKPSTDQQNADEVEKALGEEPAPVESVDGILSEEVDGVQPSAGESGDEEHQDDDDIDSLLPVEFPALAPRGNLSLSASKRANKEWAHMVDVNRDIPNFRELVPDMAREWPFELDTFQKEAVYHLENGDSVFVAAHTSAGKTVVAEYAIALAAKHMTKAIYTSPIKALSNQKFRDFRNEFDDVGILTGDVQIRPEASCLIMTTEILRSMLYRGADLIRDVEFVIFDEVHYVNDLERGVVWEEVIIMLPEHVTLILLSATVPNTYEFASWVGRTKQKNIYVISTPKRPVPLEHYLWSNKVMHKIVDADKHFIEKGWKEANDVLSGKDKVKASKPEESNANIWVHLVQHLRKENLLPACIFVFSKRRCEENADALANLDFCTASEKSAIHMIIEKSIARLKPEDRVLPQIRRLRELLSRGIAVHHGGMLPIVKEVVEILFAKTLVKILFATETFAMGLNLPTRTVVFSGYRKHDGRQFRDLLPGEYTQMAGRAGRRGLDPVGSVIIVTPGAEEAPPAARLRQMILGDPTKLRSQFRLTYNMILNLLRVEALKIEEMIKRSFSENATQALLPEHEKAVKLSEADLEKIKREACEICDVDLELCHQACMNYQRLTNELHLALLATPVGKRLFDARRLVVYKKDGVRTAGMLLRDGTSKGHEPTVQIDLAEVLKGDPEALKLASDEFQPLCEAWTFEDWNEVNMSKFIRDLTYRGLLEERRKQAEIAQNRKCLQCPKFLQHVNQNLQLLPDYEQRISVLKDLGFIDEKSRVELKGKVACEIHSADELVLTELILENVLADYEPEEIAALLSAFVFQEKTDVTPTLTPRLEQGQAKIVEISEKVNHIQTLHQVILSADDSNDFVSRPRFGMVEVVYEWARGMSFNRITDLTDVMEGTIVRVITRLDETCREVKNAARIIGDPTLYTKMQTCQELIKRDICNAASLYL